MRVLATYGMQAPEAGVQAQAVPAKGGEGHEARDLRQPCLRPPLRKEVRTSNPSLIN
jgi:hypothetical protein